MDENPANSEIRENAENPEQNLHKPKKKREVTNLKPEHFEKKTGLESLYKAVEKLDFSAGDVESNMKKFTVALKSWHFEMLPLYSFEHFLQRCKALGNSKFTQVIIKIAQNYMDKVRRIHKGQDSWVAEEIDEHDPLEKIQLNHLNPSNHHEITDKKSENLTKKVEEAQRFLNEINQREQKISEKKKTGLPAKSKASKFLQFQTELEASSVSDDECDEILKQMEILEQEKRELFFGKKEDEVKDKGKDASVFDENEESEPYVPEGYEDMNLGEDESYND